MGQLLIRMAAAVGVLIAIVALVGSFLPRDFDFEARVAIQATDQEIYDYLVDLKKWEEWSSWSEKISPDIKIEYGNSTVGDNASKRWTDVRGTGKLWLTKVEPPRQVDFQLEFRGFRDMRNELTIEKNQENEGCVVSWHSQGQLPSGPFYGYFAFLFESGMKAEYQKNLERLKQVVLQSRKKNPAKDKPASEGKSIESGL